MVVCGDNALAQRLTRELAVVYEQRVTVVLPSLRGGDHGPQIAALVGDPATAVTAVEARVPDDAALRAAGVTEAAALALTSGDDQLNVHIALRARRLNPRLRLVIRMFNRTLGDYLEKLLDRAVEVAHPELDPSAVDASTTVLSDSDTAAPSLVAAAVVGSDKIVHADGMLLRAKERALGAVSRPGSRGDREPLCTLALLPEGGRRRGARARQYAAEDAAEEDVDGIGPVLLPDEAELQGLAPGRGAVVLEAITPRDRPNPVTGRLPRLPAVRDLGTLFSPRLRASLGTMALLVTVLAGLNWRFGNGGPLHAAYLTLLDFLAINEPNVKEPDPQQFLQLLASFAGLMMLPLLLAVVLESYGAFRRATSLRSPPRGLTGHVVLLGLGKVGTRVLDRLLELDIPVVCIERDPEARGIALARSRRVPTLIADVTDDGGVLEEARIKRARALLALTSDDGTNLEAVLYARQVKPELRVAMRLFDDEFALTVYRTLRDTYPLAQTRSRSVSALAAPAFAGAMMGRQVLGAIPVGRRVLVFAALDVRGNPLLEGRTVAEAFRRDAWRVLALDVMERSREGTPRPADAPGTTPAGAYDDGASHAVGVGELTWRLHPGYVLRQDDRVVVAATRQGLATLLAGAPPEAASAAADEPPGLPRQTRP
ncbi:potassium transporter TrkA [Streptomyces sp. RKND-216]|uniref:NAD-binding protein n=1 Tax=Streptomyces sp. RKND-216 TaxID=2562581 RepID=UPI00109E154D|nr:NAD-binding protein [Streptomyces sp. RKND-216]THA27540.1 potassium transporter TrkA [Streptomyces sp. RKND-216]